MKILVTGGAGFVGSNLIKKLLELGNEVHSLDDYSAGLKENEINGAIYHNGDINTIHKLDKDFELIYHLAALSRIQPSFKYPTITFNSNTLGTQSVCEFARKINATLIYSGSSSKHHNPTLSPYAMSKYLGEELIKMYKNVYNLKANIVRFYNVYGEGELVDSHMAAVIGIFRNQIEKGLPITIHGDGEQRRDFTYIDDIVDGLIKISESDIIHDDAWELGSGKNYSINEVFDIFKDNFVNIEKVYIQDIKGNYRETIRTNDDALTKLKWNPKGNLKQYINKLKWKTN